MFLLNKRKNSRPQRETTISYEDKIQQVHTLICSAGKKTESFRPVLPFLDLYLEILYPIRYGVSVGDEGSEHSHR